MTNNVKGNTALKGDEKKEAVKMTVVKSDVLPVQAAAEPKPEVLPVQEEVKQEQPKPLSFEQIREKGQNLFNLMQKYDDVKGKAEDLKSFELLHNEEMASIVISDVKGRSFTSRNPKAIAKFIEFCGEQLTETLNSLETEMRKLA